jgi:hypothetical protein
MPTSASERPPLFGAANDLWAITCYFNPLSYNSRRANYRMFHERLGVPLVTVELAYGLSFELGEADADILIQLRGGDVLWQKERLLNLALEALPAECRRVAWLDCDILFGERDWAERTNELLDHVPVAHLYSKVHYLPPGGTPGGRGVPAEAKRRSIVAAVASGLSPRTCLEAANGPSVGNYSTGLAWAARRELLQKHLFYDALIIGGGDRAMVAAVYGCFDHLIHRQGLNERQSAHFMAWAEPFHHTVVGDAGFVPGDVYHLWHGTLEERRWYARFRPMPTFRFDPLEDIVLTESGVWRWNSHKPDLHAYVRDHFVQRREDG